MVGPGVSAELASPTRNTMLGLLRTVRRYFSRVPRKPSQADVMGSLRMTRSPLPSASTMRGRRVRHVKLVSAVSAVSPGTCALDVFACTQGDCAPLERRRVRRLVVWRFRLDASLVSKLEIAKVQVQTHTTTFSRPHVACLLCQIRYNNSQ